MEWIETGVREGQSTTTFFPPSLLLAGTVITGYGKVKRGCGGGGGGGGTLAAVGRGREGGREGAPPCFPAVKSGEHRYVENRSCQYVEMGKSFVCGKRLISAQHGK